jgi:hypothetical protein
MERRIRSSASTSGSKVLANSRKLRIVVLIAHGFKDLHCDLRTTEVIVEICDKRLKHGSALEPIMSPRSSARFQQLKCRMRLIASG